MVLSDLYHLGGVIGIQRVHHIVEIGAVRQSPLWKPVGEVGHHLRVLFEQWEELVHAELIVLGDLDEFDFREL